MPARKNGYGTMIGPVPKSRLIAIKAALYLGTSKIAFILLVITPIQIQLNIITDQINYRSGNLYINKVIQMKAEQERNQCEITVSDPQVRKQYGGAKQYYLYTIKGHDIKGPIDIQRRYSDFDSIRNLLIKRWPGCYIPSLPSKVKLAHSDEEFLQTRSKYLQKFLSELSLKAFLWQSDQMQIFLRNKMTDFDKIVTSLWKVQPQELLYRYEIHFKDIEGEDQAKMEQKIQEFSKYLQTLNVKVQQLRNRSQQINNAQAKYQKKYSKFLLNVLNSYEQKFVHYYNQNNNSFIPIFSSPQNCEKKNILEQSLKQAPLKILFQELKREKREIFAIQQSLKEYEQYSKQKQKIQGKIKQHQIKIDQLKNGKKSFLSKIRSLPTDDEIKSHQKAIQKYKADLQRFITICAFIKKILFTKEIQSFKQERTASYYRMVRSIAKEELNIIQKERDFWHSVLNNNNFNFQIEEDSKNISQTTVIKKAQQKKQVYKLEQEKVYEVVKVRPPQSKQVKQEDTNEPLKEQKQIQAESKQQQFIPSDDAFEDISDKDKQQTTVTQDKQHNQNLKSVKEAIKDTTKAKEQPKTEFVQIEDD